MRRPIWKRAGLAAAALLAGLTAAAPSQGEDLGGSNALLGVGLEFPLLFFGSPGHLAYDADTNLLRLEAQPLTLRLAPGSDAVPITPFGGGELVSFSFLVDETGAVVGGVDGDDLVVTGELTLPGIGAVGGTLLTAEIVDFGWLDTGPTKATDFFDFRFLATGGPLAPFWPTNQITGFLGSDGSVFTGSFEQSFRGGATGKLTGVPEPATALLLLGGLSGLFAAGRPRR